jgi:hypothetical protein
MTPSKYIDRMMDLYQPLFGTKPKTKYSSPLAKGDHLELDTSPELDIKGIEIFLSIIGVAQWVVSLGCLDVATAIMKVLHLNKDILTVSSDYMDISIRCDVQNSHSTSIGLIILLSPFQIDQDNLWKY